MKETIENILIHLFWSISIGAAIVSTSISVRSCNEKTADLRMECLKGGEEPERCNQMRAD